jgi:hypothetical protein
MKRFLLFKDWLVEGQMKDAMRWGSKKTDDFHDRKIELLSEIASKLKGKKWWMDAGTLLGSVRGGDFIKGDNDIDIGIHAKHMSKELCAKINESPKLDVAEGSGDMDKFYKTEIHLLDDDGKRVSVGGKGVFNDIYVYYPVENDYVMGDSGKYYRIPKPHLDKLTTGTIRGKRFPIPSDAKNLLEFVYGEDWETPNRGKTFHGNTHSTFMNKLKSYRYDRSKNKGICQYTKAHLNEINEEKKKQSK